MLKLRDEVKVLNIDCENSQKSILILKNYIGQTGIITKRLGKKFLVKFSNGLEWCFRESELEKGHYEWVKDED